MGTKLLLFPGQGSQAVGMGAHLWETYSSARETFREAEDILGWDLRGLCLRGPIEELTRTDNAQLTIFVCSVATWRVLEARDAIFDIAIGHSLGEYSALVATGHLSFADAVRVVERRGRAMWEATQLRPGTMAAIMGLADPEVESVCSGIQNVWPANYNCPGQVVVSGTQEGVGEARLLAVERGAKRAIPLQVSGGFHSPLMADSVSGLAAALDEATFSEASKGRFFSTTEVGYPEASELEAVMTRQLTSPVRFTQSVSALADDLSFGIELGPGGVLSGLVKRIAPRVPVHGTGNGAELEELLRHVEAICQRAPERVADGRRGTEDD